MSAKYSHYDEIFKYSRIFNFEKCKLRNAFEEASSQQQFTQLFHLFQTFCFQIEIFKY